MAVGNVELMHKMFSETLAHVGWLFLYFIYDAHILIISLIMGVFNEIIERAIFIFKINTNIISIHIDIEYRNTYFVPICIV